MSYVTAGTDAANATAGVSGSVNWPSPNYGHGGTWNNINSVLNQNSRLFFFKPIIVRVDEIDQLHPYANLVNKGSQV